MKISKEKIIYNLLIFGSVSAILIGSIKYAKANNQELFNCHNFIITGCELVGEESIRNQLSYLKKESILSINKNDIITKLINNEFISSANLSIILPNTIFISILEVKPITIVSIGDSNFLVDDNKYFVPFSINKNQNIQIPRIFFNNISEIHDVFNQSEYQFIRQAYLDYPLLYDKIDQIKLRDDILIASFSDNSVYFDSNEYASQLEYLSEFFNTLNKYMKEPNYEYIKFAGSNIIVKEKKEI